MFKSIFGKKSLEEAFLLQLGHWSAIIDVWDYSKEGRYNFAKLHHIHPEFNFQKWDFSIQTVVKKLTKCKSCEHCIPFTLEECEKYDSYVVDWFKVIRQGPVGIKEAEKALLIASRIQKILFEKVKILSPNTIRDLLLIEPLGYKIVESIESVELD